jgi:DNA-binding NtrC family response regulator
MGWGRLTKTQLAALGGYDYPGNVRELINILDRARALEESDFAKLIDEHIRINRDLREPKDANELPENLAEAMRAHVKSVYARHGGNMAQARKALGISLNTLKKYLRSKD